MAFRNYRLCENRRSESHIWKLKRIHIHTSHIYHPMYVKVGVRDLHTMLLSICEFCENLHTEPLSFCDFCENLPSVLLSICEFCENLHTTVKHL